MTKESLTIGERPEQCAFALAVPEPPKIRALPEGPLRTHLHAKQALRQFLKGYFRGQWHKYCTVSAPRCAW